MATNLEQSRERGEGRERESRGQQNRHGESRGASPLPERGSATPDTTAIEAARAHALAAGTVAREEEHEKDRPLFDFATRAKDVAVGVGGGGLQILGGGLAIAGFLGYQTSRPVLFTTARALDWIGRKMNGWADKLIDKKIPMVSWLLNPLVSLIDTSAKSLGLDKTLAEHLRKNAQDRKKLAEKVLKDYLIAQTKQEKKEDEAKAKAKRRKVIEEKLGPDVAGAIVDDVDAIAAAADSKGAEVPKSVEAPKAT